MCPLITALLTAATADVTKAVVANLVVLLPSDCVGAVTFPAMVPLFIAKSSLESPFKSALELTAVLTVVYQIAQSNLGFS